MSNWKTCLLEWQTVLWEGNGASEASKMTESERAVIPQQIAPSSMFCIQERQAQKRGLSGMDY